MKAKNYSKALIYHLQWKVQFKKFLDGEGDFNIAELTVENCKLWKWLHSEEILKYTSPSEIRQIEKVHNKCHERAKRVYALKKLDEDANARQELKKLEADSMKLASLLTTLKAIREN